MQYRMSSWLDGKVVGSTACRPRVQFLAGAFFFLMHFFCAWSNRTMTFIDASLCVCALHAHAQCNKRMEISVDSVRYSCAVISIVERADPERQFIICFVLFIVHAFFCSTYSCGYCVKEAEKNEAPVW